MVGAQKATKMASNLFPDRNIYSATTIMDRTTRSNKTFIAPIFSTKFLNIFFVANSNRKIMNISGVAQ